MKWTAITLYELALPLQNRFETAGLKLASRRLIVARNEFKNGVTVWSECAALETPSYSAETVDTAWFALTRWLIPLVMQRPWQHPNEVDALLHQSVTGHLMAKATLEMAAWAAHAVNLGQPLAQLLGGTRKTVASGMVIGLLPNSDLLLAAIASAHHSGYPRIKIKIKPGNDLALLAAIRHQFGNTLRLMADANCSYTLSDLPTLRAMDDFGLDMLEQPLAADDLYHHHLLQPRIQTPLCLDESLSNVQKVAEMRLLGSGRIVNLKPGRVGGFTQSLRIHDYCLQHRMPMWCGGMLESGIGRAYLHALASLPGFDLPGDLSPAHTYLTQNLLQTQPKPHPNGSVDVGWTHPGLGIEVDESDILRLAHREERISG